MATQAKCWLVASPWAYQGFFFSQLRFVDAGTKVDSEVFCTILEQYYTPLLLDVAWTDRRKLHFFQDNAPSHCSKMISSWLREAWKDLGLVCEQLPPQSPDLTPCDFWLWSLLKSRLPEKAASPMERKNQVIQTWSDMKTDPGVQETLRGHLGAEWMRRLRRCIELDGDHVE